jgi:hypothetical protein
MHIFDAQLQPMAHLELVSAEKAPTAALIEDGADNEGHGIGGFDLMKGRQVDLDAAKKGK